MEFSKKKSIQLIIVTAFVVTILSDIESIFYILKNLRIEDFSERYERPSVEFYLITLQIPYKIILFTILALFNYTWKDKIVPKNLIKTGKVFLIIFTNILIFYLSALLENSLITILFEKFERPLSTTFFIYENIYIFLLAVTEAYILLLFGIIKTAEIENIRLKEEKTSAELSALRKQISPHFFFNTLSSLSTIIRNEKKEVGLAFIQELSKTYRYTLSSSKQDLVSLKEELNFVKSYFFVIQKRFGDKLIFNINVPNNKLQSKILPMSLQSLVENAIQHNVLTKAAPLTINIFTKDNMICVENKLQKKDRSDGLGLGLENLANRFHLLAQKDIIIEKNQHHFRVRLPLL